MLPCLFRYFLVIRRRLFSGLFLLWLLLITQQGFGQCSLLSTSISVDFSANGTCAPVTVNTFEVTYTFNAAQNPADIEIQFVWNDPGGTVDVIDLGSGLIVSNMNRTYQAIAPVFPYPDTGPECFFEAQASIIVAGDLCETSEQTQVVPSWNTDDQNGGMIAFDPGQYRVCENAAINNAVFADASVFNCNINDNPDNPNQISRFTQFVYGTDPAPAVGRIRDVTLDDGGTVNLTDGAGNLVAPQTRGTGAVMVTAAYFGAVVEVPFPADVPNNVSLPISAPANPANVVGSTFQITLFNWNTCNPYNGDPVDPNYEDAVSEVLDVDIIVPPTPAFVAQDAMGGTPAAFCINEDIFFVNGTGGPGPYQYTWEFFDGPLDTDPLLATIMATDPTFQFANGGVKLVRLTATDLNSNDVCSFSFDATVTLSPDAVADFEFFDAGFTMPITPEFCQTGADMFTVGFRDNTVDVPGTEYRYEFYDEADLLIDTEPTSGAFLPNPVPDFTRTYSAEEVVRVRLVARNTTTLCGSIDESFVIVYGLPLPTFNALEVCAGERTEFSAITDPTTGFTTRVNNDVIDQYEWDFSYDGVTFNPELTLADNSDFNWYLDGNPVVGEVEPPTSVAGTYTIALRTTTQLGMCSDLFQTDVTVKTLPDANFTSNYAVPICPDEPITFTNNSVQPPEVTIGGPVSYELVIDDNIGSPTMVIPFIGPDLTMNFDNTTGANINYFVSLQATGANPNNCVQVDGPQVLVVKAAFESGFDDPAFDPFGENCSPLTGTLIVDVATQALSVNSYTWTIFDGTDPIDGFPQTINSGAPNFHQLDYQIDNNSQSAMNYRVLLEPELAGVCVNSSEIMLRVNPVPLTSFSQTDNIDECDTKEVIFTADQAGLVTYEWSFSTPPDIIDDQGEELRALWNRPDAASGDLVVTVTLDTENGFDCPAPATTNFDLLVSAQPDDINAACSVNPEDLVLPASTVEVINNTVDNNFSFSWDFGDGTTSNQRDPGTHTFESEGSFDVTLTVTSGFCEETRTHRVNILPTFPVVDFEADNPDGCPPHVVNFTNLSQFAQDSLYLWDFGDGNTSTEVNPSNLYLEPGRYTVTLQATNSLGDTDTEIKQFFVEIFDLPIASFDPRPQEVFLPASVTMVNLSRGASTYEWSFGDGGASEEIEPIYEYTEEGDYDVTLVATSEDGCTDTITIGAAVNAVIGGEVRAPNAFTPNPDGPNGGAVNGAGGGLNDVFLPLIAGVTDFKMQIFNRWGNIMFETTSREVGWDGYFNGRLAPQGVYVYRLELTFQNDQRSVRVGDFTLIR